MENDTIQNALMALIKSVDNSNLPINAVNILKKLLENLCIYYANKKNEIDNSVGCEYNKHRTDQLYSQMTDYIVAINDSLKGKNDVFCIANMIYKEINYDEKKGVFKRKRLI